MHEDTLTLPINKIDGIKTFAQKHQMEVVELFSLMNDLLSSPNLSEEDVFGVLTSMLQERSGKGIVYRSIDDLN